MRSVKLILAFAGAIGLSVTAAPVSAATVTQCGTDICYQYDDAQSGISSFGAPTVVGDALVWVVPNFRAESLGGAGTDTALDSFVIDSIYSLSGAPLLYVGIIEQGDYSIVNGDGVSAQLDLYLEDNDTGENGTVSELFSALGDSGGVQEWQISAFHNPSMYFSSAEDVSVTITDTLIAETDSALEAAWIQKKIAIGATTIVPIPAAVWLFASALGLFGFMRRR